MVLFSLRHSLLLELTDVKHCKAVHILNRLSREKATVKIRHDTVQLQGEKFSVQPTTDFKLGTSGRRVGTRTGAGVIATLG